MKVLLATPTTQGSVTTAYAHTLVAATQALTEAKAAYKLMIVDGADVVLARTIMAHAFLEDESLTHLLFIDSDMAVDIQILRHLLSLGAPIIGAAYTERRLDLEAFAKAMAETPDMDRARALSAAFTLRLTPGRKEVRKGVMEAEGFGFGCVLIARAVFELMIERGVARPKTSAKLRASGLKGEIWNFFDPIERPDGDQLSEDYAFCARVRELGDVPLLAYVGPGVGHVGPFTYGAAFIERLKADRG